MRVYAENVNSSRVRLFQVLTLTVLSSCILLFRWYGFKTSTFDSTGRGVTDRTHVVASWLLEPLHLDCEVLLAESKARGDVSYQVTNHLNNKILTMYGHAIEEGGVRDSVTNEFTKGHYFGHQESRELYDRPPARVGARIRIAHTPLLRHCRKHRRT